MLTFSQLLRFSMAAGMYLLLMWGYLVLPNAQWFAAFLALILSSMLVFWVTESVVAATTGARRFAVAGNAGLALADFGGGHCSRFGGTQPDRSRPDRTRPGLTRPGLTMADWQDRPDLPCGGDLTASVQDLQQTVARLDALKAELNLQYAQFGRDQSALNRDGLGSWNGRKDHDRRS